MSRLPQGNSRKRVTKDNVSNIFQSLIIRRVSRMETDFMAPSVPSIADVEVRILKMAKRYAAVRQEFHRHPELSGEEGETAAKVASMLRNMGYDVVEGIGGHGIVATLSRGAGSRSIGLRADMDALPITEDNALEYSSTRTGVMHACGHDGHTATLLCAAEELALHGGFNGTLRLIFQPAEEIGAGSNAMLEDGLLERFPINAIFGMHNWPNLPLGKVGLIWGPCLASSDTGSITVTGRAGHGAYPHLATDPIVAAAAIICAIQTIVSRNVDPLETAVATIGSIHGGTAASTIPETVAMKFTLRAFKEEVRQSLKRRFHEVVEGQARSLGSSAEIVVERSVSPLFNHPVETDFVREVAREIAGDEIIETLKPMTGGEDFAHFLQHRPGCYIHIGAGQGAPLHSPRYDFNDDLIAPAALLWSQLARRYLV